MTDSPTAPTESPAPRWTRREFAWAAGLLVATVLVYLPALRGGFIWNDSDYVTAPALRSLAGLPRIWFEIGATEQYYPLLHSAFWVQQWLWGDAPAGYHLVNVLIHAGNALLLVALLRALAVRGAWLAGALFALHPVGVESVAWIAEQKNTLSTLFYLLAALVYLRFDSGRRLRDYGVASAWFVAALLTKSLTATLVGALLVGAWWRRGRLEWRRDVLPLVPWTVLGAAAGLFTGWVEWKVLRAEGADFALTLGERALLAGRVVWFYLGKLAWPSELIFIYPRWEVDARIWWQYLYPAFLVGAAAVLWLFRRRSRAPLAVLLLFIGSLFPTSGFFNVYGFLFSYVADHWQYLPSLWIHAAAGAALTALAARLPAGPLRAVPGAAILMILAGLTWRQGGLYRDIESFYQQTIAANPKCWMALNNLGNLRAERGDMAAATADYERALALKPDRFEVHNNFALALIKLRRWQDAASHLEQAIRLNPRSFISYHNLGLILRMHGQNETAVGYFRRALEVKPDYNPSRNALGLALHGLGRSHEALVEFDAALQREPGDTEALNHAGIVLTDLGRLAEAEQVLRRAIALQPGFAGAYDNLGNTYRKAGRLPDAARNYETALRLNPDSPVTLVNLTLALIELGRLPEAIARGEQAVKLDPNLPEARFNLALALRAAGRLDAAREHYAIARRQKPTLGPVPDLESVR